MQGLQNASVLGNRLERRIDSTCEQPIEDRRPDAVRQEPTRRGWREVSADLSRTENPDSVRAVSGQLPRILRASAHDVPEVNACGVCRGACQQPEGAPESHSLLGRLGTTWQGTAWQRP